MTGEVFDSGVFCPLCFSAPAMEIRFTSDGKCRAVCMVCLTSYELDRADNGGLVFCVHIPYERLLGSTGETILKELGGKMLVDSDLDVETRRQLHKLEGLGLVSVVSNRKERMAYWRLTEKGLEVLGEKDVFEGTGSRSG